MRGVCVASCNACSSPSLDGTTVFVRPIAPEDKPLLVAGLRQLSARTVYRRFMSPKTRFTDAELRYLTEVDGHDHIALVASSARRARRRRALRARERRHRRHGDRRRRPVAGAGARAPVGSRLLAMAAAAHGIKRFAGTLLADNRPALRIMKGVGSGFEVDELSHGVREIVTRLAA